MPGFQFGFGLGITPNTGGGGPFHSKAQALLTAINNAPTIGTVSGNDIPTITMGSAFGNSTLNGIAFGANNPTVQAYSATLIQLSTECIINGGAGSPFATSSRSVTSTGLIGGGAGWGLKFRINANAFDVGIYDNSNSVRAKINGNWSTPFVASAAGWIKYAFPTKAVREIELYFAEGTVLTGINVAAGDTIGAAAALTMPVAAIFGDSYVAGTYSAEINSVDKPVGTFAARLRDTIGLLDTRFWGFEGEGAVRTNVTNGKTFLDRANAGEFARKTVDLLIIPNTINDYASTAATVKANWKTIIQRAMADQPNALIFGFSGFKTSSSNVDPTHNAAFVDAFNEVKDGSRMKCWDGDGQIITIGGNDATYIAADGLHLTDAGALYSAGVVKGQIVSWLATL